MPPIEGDAWKIANWLRRHDPRFEHSAISVIRRAREVAENGDVTVRYVLRCWLRAMDNDQHSQRGLLAMFHRQGVTND